MIGNDTVAADDATRAVEAPAVCADVAPPSGEWVESAYHQFAGELWAVLYAGTCNPELARDAVQEAFLRLQRQDSKSIRDVRAWLIHVGRNWIRDQHRRNKRVAPTTGELGHLVGEAPGPLDALLNAEQRELVRSGLLELRHEDRHALVLRYALNWSSARIAQTLDVRPAAIDMRLSRARKRLADLLRDRGISPEEIFDKESRQA